MNEREKVEAQQARWAAARAEMVERVVALGREFGIADDRIVDALAEAYRAKLADHELSTTVVSGLAGYWTSFPKKEQRARVARLTHGVLQAAEGAGVDVMQLHPQQVRSAAAAVFAHLTLQRSLREAESSWY